MSTILTNRHKKNKYFLYRLLKSTSTKNQSLFLMSVKIIDRHDRKNLARDKWAGTWAAQFGPAAAWPSTTGNRLGLPEAGVEPCFDLAGSPLCGHNMACLAQPDYGQW
jgi:hypothetical protein